MTIQSLKTTLNRVSAAYPHPPIAVFKTSNPLELDTKFYRTIFTIKECKNNPNFIGKFDRCMDILTVRRVITKATEKPYHAA